MSKNIRTKSEQAAFNDGYAAALDQAAQVARGLPDVPDKLSASLLQSVMLWRMQESERLIVNRLDRLERSLKEAHK